MTKLIHVSGSDHITQELVSDGPQTFTVTGVTEVTMDGEKQRHAVTLAETAGKTWVPAFTVLKALAQVWSMEKENWVGQKLTLYRDPSVKIGRETVGGIRVSHVTGITEPRTVNVKGALNRTVTYKFSPLQAEKPREATITQAQWEYLLSKSEGDFGATLLWASQQLSRTIKDPREITADEAGRLKNELDSMTPATEGVSA